MQKLFGEVFKEYYPGYLFSNLGRVYSLKSKKFLKPYPNSHGYMRVGICINGPLLLKQKRYFSYIPLYFPNKTNSASSLFFGILPLY